MALLTSSRLASGLRLSSAAQLMTMPGVQKPHCRASCSTNACCADFGTAEGCAALVAAEPSADILVNNVGIFGPQDFFQIPDSEWTRLFEVKVMSGVRLSRAYLPGMVERNWRALHNRWFVIR